MKPIKRILCATDFSDCSFQALDYAIDFVQRMEARLEVVHVLQSSKPDSGRGPDLESQVIKGHLQGKFTQGHVVIFFIAKDVIILIGQTHV